MPTQTLRCPACFGTGKTPARGRARIERYQKGVLFAKGEPCQRCNGTGKIAKSN
jgi:DnaJ-class molecular chaperone